MRLGTFSRRPLTAVMMCGAALCFVAGCSSGRSSKPVTVGATASTQQVILAEIAAQHLEKQLGIAVTRKMDIGSTSMGYESLLMSEVDIVPEETNAICTSVLKEPVDPNPDIVLQRVRGEMSRLGKVLVLDPLGIRRVRCMVLKAGDAHDGKLSTISDAARSQLAWTVGETSEFQVSSDGHTALMSTYNLPLKVAPKILTPGMMYLALSQNQVSMVSGFDTDGALAGPEFVSLKDDKGAFRESRSCLMAREETLNRDPKIRPALDQLSGKFTNDAIRQLSHQVDVERRSVKDVAAAFLSKAGL